jgi:hypothetical protein
MQSVDPPSRSLVSPALGGHGMDSKEVCAFLLHYLIDQWQREEEVGDSRTSNVDLE